MPIPELINIQAEYLLLLILYISLDIVSINVIFKQIRQLIRNYY